jgi:hypothetical protein
VTENHFTFFNPPKYSPKLQNLTGRKFNRFLVLGLAGVRRKSTMWHCLCTCGQLRAVQANNLQSGQHQSCGCLDKENLIARNLTHGEAVRGQESPEYAAYCSAKERCLYRAGKSYPTYGGQGIEFRFTSFAEFLAEVGRKPTPQHTLDRIDNKGHYEIGNVRWATRKEQMRNTSKNHRITIDGVTKCLVDWYAHYRISPTGFKDRKKRGWCDECALTLPSRSNVRCSHS